MSSAGGAATQLTFFNFDGIKRPIWSPDSSRLVAAYQGGCNQFDVGGFYIINIDPNLGGPRRITQCVWGGPDIWADWSPNGKRLALIYGSNIATMNPDGSGVILVGPNAYQSGGPSHSNPIWTPDGKKVIYVYGVYPFADLELYAANADGTGYIDLTNTSSNAEWQPDLGRGLVCQMPTIQAPPTQTISSPWPYDLEDVNPNWSMTAEVSPSDGLVLKDVRLGQRYMAKRISVPHYTLETSAFQKKRGELKPNSSDPTIRSRLVDFTVNTDAEKLVVEATYAIDAIGQSCLRITQRYEFYRQGVGGGCEPSEELPCSRWKPIVDYHFVGKNGETLTSINIVQRQHKRIDDNPYNTVGLFKDCDTPPRCDISAGNTLPGLFGYERKENPLYYETSGRAISRGQNSNEWDNIHQTYRGRISEPPICLSCGPSSYFVGGGCPECEHSHWRWGAMFGGAFNNGRVLGIPAGSYQDLDFAIVRYQSGEEDPSAEVKDLVQTSQLIRTYNTSGRNPLQINWGSAPEEVVVWYSALGIRIATLFLVTAGFLTQR